MDGDDEFFGSLESSQSNLSSIFGDSSQMAEDHSLKYSSPKQTKPEEVGENSKKTNSSWNVEIAKVVTAYKVLNHENIPQGKIGLAVLKNTEGDFKIILYKTKANVLSTLTLTEGVKLYLKSSYLQFSDDDKAFWSVLFEGNDAKPILDIVESKFGKVLVQDPQKKQPESQITRTPSEKATILSRITKMGQPLPKLAEPITTTDMSDSSDTEIIKNPPKPALVPRKQKTSTQIVALPTQIPPPSLISYNPQIIQDSQYINMLLTENRTQNCEIRMNISKLETKIDNFLDKVDLVKGRSGKTDKEDEILELEEKILELKKENRKLKRDIPEKEEFSILKFDNFSDFIRKLGVLEYSFENSDDFCLKVLQTANLQADSLEEQLQCKQTELMDASSELDTQKAQNSQLKAEISDLRKMIASLEQNIEKKAEKDGKEEESVQDLVKGIMNNLYESICGSFTGDKSYNSQEILKICGNAIKQETKNALRDRGQRESGKE